MRNIWNIVSAVAAVAAVAIALFVFFQGRLDQRKQLSVELLSRSSLVNESLDPADRGIEVMLNGRVIPNYANFQIRIMNSGGRPILGEDFETPLTLWFTGVSEIVSVDQTGGDPVGLKVQPHVASPQEVVIQPGLLNPTDWYGLEVGVVPTSGDVPSVMPRGRIAGLKEIAFRDLVAEPRGNDKSGMLEILLRVQAVLALILSIYVFFRGWKRTSSNE